MKTVLFFLISAIAFPCLGQEGHPEINVISGDHHLFTVETPEGWVNDKEAAESINLVSYFYPKGDSKNKDKSYVYAMGYDKRNPKDSLQGFVEADLKTYRSKYPKFKYKDVRVQPSGGILNAVMYTFDNLSDRYKEEVLYMETDSAVLVFSFSATTKQAYILYQPVFDKFVGSFKYRGNDPKPFLEWEKKQK
jgi:hypothetical protein